MQNGTEFNKLLAIKCQLTIPAVQPELMMSHEIQLEILTAV